MPFSLHASTTPALSAYRISQPASICANAASFAFGGSYHDPINVTLNLMSGLTDFAPFIKA